MGELISSIDQYIYLINQSIYLSIDQYAYHTYPHLMVQLRTWFFFTPEFLDLEKAVPYGCYDYLMISAHGEAFEHQ